MFATTLELIHFNQFLTQLISSKIHGKTVKVVLMFYTFANGEKLHLYQVKEYKQTMTLNYLKIIDHLQIAYYIHFSLFKSYK